MSKLRRIAMALYVCMFTLFAVAQPAATPQAEATDFMRSNGKIYVVIAVVVVIVTGLFLYLVNLDRKITKLEKNRDKL
jgi:CcmD family protein